MHLILCPACSFRTPAARRMCQTCGHFRDAHSVIQSMQDTQLAQLCPQDARQQRPDSKFDVAAGIANMKNSARNKLGEKLRGWAADLETHGRDHHLDSEGAEDSP